MGSSLLCVAYLSRYLVLMTQIGSYWCSVFLIYLRRDKISYQHVWRDYPLSVWCLLRTSRFYLLVWSSKILLHCKFCFRYERTVSELGATAFDQQVPPLDKAVWWIEYVLRHNGAKHLQYKGVDLPAYQFYLLDVFCFLGAVFVFILYAFYKISKTLIVGFRFLNRNRKSDDFFKKSQ